ncbi:Uncharacterised protein [Mycolicibacterium vanbaalenii]|uniref:Uncharacterized protein n=1 Tax=Mycolicibacterium vanbaalenii TaxID=110539 RepID=A0A5S9QZD1_MYCVN|nr:hypothetical protein [Mycolicibacterium vanbaalenii]CAA0124887.1 Uncharacterised protein [Mycolicibacterium vanbaalenii]
MLSLARRVLEYRMTVAEWIGIALLLGAPYFVIGVLWSLTRSGAAVDLRAILLWPMLLISDGCMP